VSGWDTQADLGKEAATIPDPATTQVPQELREQIEASMALYPDRHSAAIPALHAAQELHGWCSPQALEQVACVMRVTPASLEAVATFYDMLETEPPPPGAPQRGRHAVYVCTNISCSLHGADALYDAMREAVTGDPGFIVRAFECLGACDIAPMASVDGVYVGPLDRDDIPQLLDDARAGREILPAKQLARRLVADPQANSQAFPEHDAQPPRPLAGRQAMAAEQPGGARPAGRGGAR